jgi:glycosyltransferase involved in cell wall biosynthesis
MKVVYTAPNRGHHYKYATALNEAGYLYAFVSGFPRINPRAKAIVLEGKLFHADIMQTVYLGSLKARLPSWITNWLAYLSKIEQDNACRKFMKGCDIFLFYNGSGLNSSRYGKKNGAINIVEAVNSHVEYQEDILEQEYKNLNLKWEPFSQAEKTRRIKEYEEADYILLPSEFVKKSFIEKGFPEEKLLKVPYGFNKLTNYYPTNCFNHESESFTILYVGSISVRKGIRYLIQAFNKVDHPKKKLVIVGPNTHDGALNGVILDSNIVFTGILKGEQLDNAYRTANIFCLPSIEEGLALVLGEALAFGLPIIATCNTGAEDIITDGIEGYIVPIRDAEAIRQRLQVLANGPELMNQLRSKCYEKSSDLSGWEETGKNLTQVLYKAYRHAHSK